MTDEREAQLNLLKKVSNYGADAVDIAYGKFLEVLTVQTKKIENIEDRDRAMTAARVAYKAGIARLTNAFTMNINHMMAAIKSDVP